MTTTSPPDHGNRLLAAFPPQVLELAKRDMRTVSLAQGRILYEVGAPIDTIYFPQTGLLSLLIVTESGGMIESAERTAHGCRARIASAATTFR